jgi:hypothetical protein
MLTRRHGGRDVSMLLLEMSPGPRLGGIVRRALGCFKSLQIIEVRGGRLGARDARLLKEVSEAPGPGAAGRGPGCCAGCWKQAGAVMLLAAARHKLQWR